MKKYQAPNAHGAGVSHIYFAQVLVIQFKCEIYQLAYTWKNRK
jgi:hypothetical protein